MPPTYIQAYKYDFTSPGTNPIVESPWYQAALFQQVDTVSCPHCAYVGTIPDRIGTLTHLKRISIGTGEQQVIHGTIPASIGDLHSLTSLRLGRVASGSIPGSLGKLTQLQSLWLDEMDIDSLDVIGSLTNLQQLYITVRRSDIGMTIPHSLSTLTKLTTLSFNQAHMVGSIPEWIGDLSHLTMFDVRHNQLTGSIPLSMGKLTQLAQFQAYGLNMRLDGCIPACIDICNPNFNGDTPWKGPPNSDFAWACDLRHDGLEVDNAYLPGTSNPDAYLCDVC